MSLNGCEIVIQISRIKLQMFYIVLLWKHNSSDSEFYSIDNWLLLNLQAFGTVPLGLNLKEKKCFNVFQIDLHPRRLWTILNWLDVSVFFTCRNFLIHIYSIVFRFEKSWSFSTYFDFSCVHPVGMFRF